MLILAEFENLCIWHPSRSIEKAHTQKKKKKKECIERDISFGGTT